MKHPTANNENIVLIGMPGAGKSTVGVVLAKILNMDFLDTDLLIQKKHGETLQRLIDNLGAEGFVTLEGETLQDISVESTVIATGGSAVYSIEEVKSLSENGTVVFLDASLPELEKRLSNFSERGIVIRNGSTPTLEGILEDRMPFFEKLANERILIDGLDITEAALQIAKACGKKLWTETSI